MDGGGRVWEEQVQFQLKIKTKEIKWLFHGTCTAGGGQIRDSGFQILASQVLVSAILHFLFVSRENTLLIHRWDRYLPRFSRYLPAGLGSILSIYSSQLQELSTQYVYCTVLHLFEFVAPSMHACMHACIHPSIHPAGRNNPLKSSLLDPVPSIFRSCSCATTRTNLRGFNEIPWPFSHQERGYA